MKRLIKLSNEIKIPARAIAVVTAAVLLTATNVIAETGVTKDQIILGGVMDLNGRSQALGQGMKTGIEAALSGKRIKGRSIEYMTLNDSYNPDKTRTATEELLERGVFAMVGNVGTPTAGASLPMLFRAGVPAVGFFTGAGLLRPGKGDIINFRASYVQETAAVINSALGAGLLPAEICAYVQNDGYGMAGIAGVKSALSGEDGSADIIEKLDELSSLTGENPFRNGIGPVGVYKRNTFTSRNGYESLKQWEETSGVNCRLIVTVGAYASIANFIGYASSKGEDWIYSAVSFTGAENLKNALAEFGVNDNLIVTQVVPPLDSDLDIVKDAKAALGPDLSYISLEGYIVGRFLLKVLEEMPNKDVTRRDFLTTVRGNTFDIGGLTLDFSSDNQGSDLVVSTYLDGGGFRILSDDEMAAVLR